MNQTMKLKNLRCQHCLFHLKNLQSSFSKSILVRSTVRSGAKGHSSILNRNDSTNRTVESWVLLCSLPTPGWLHSYSQCQQTALPLQTLQWASHLSLLYPCTGKVHKNHPKQGHHPSWSGIVQTQTRGQLRWGWSELFFWAGCGSALPARTGVGARINRWDLHHASVKNWYRAGNRRKKSF